MGFLLCRPDALTMKSRTLTESCLLTRPDQPPAGWHEHYYQYTDGRELTVRHVLAPGTACMIDKRIDGTYSIEQPCHLWRTHHAVHTQRIAEQVRYMRPDWLTAEWPDQAHHMYAQAYGEKDDHDPAENDNHHKIVRYTLN